MAGLSDLVLRVRADTTQASGSIKDFGQQVGGMGGGAGGLGGLTKGLGKLGLALGALGIAKKAGQYLGDATQAAADLGKTAHRASVLLGDGYDAVDQWAKGAANSLGLSRDQALDAAATFAKVGTAMGKSGDDMAEFTTGMATLAVDIASFREADPADVVSALGKAFKGQTRPLKEYGINLSEADIKQQALTMGLIATTKEGLDPQSRALATQALILAKSSDAQGDFAKTSGDLANKQRIATANADNLRVTLGGYLLPATIAVSTATGKLFEGIATLARGFFDLFRKGGPLAPLMDGIRSAVAKVTDAVTRNSDSWSKLGGFLKVVVVAGFGPLLLLLPRLGPAISAIGTVLGAVIDSFARWVDIISSVVGAVQRLIDMLGRIPKISLPKIPGLGSVGGAAAGATPFGGGPPVQTITYRVNIQGAFAATPDAMARAVTEALRRSQRRGAVAAAAAR